MGKSVKLYFAYGMNTHRDQMSMRCPGARPLGRAVLHGHKFEFKSFATVTPSEKDSLEGVLWTITKSDEWALDILEGYPKFYDKKSVVVEHDGQRYIAMTYFMDPREQIRAPSASYYSLVSEGYQQFGLSQSQLLNALPTALKLTTMDFD